MGNKNKKDNIELTSIFNHLNSGQRAADMITSIVGSWKFLIIQSFLLMCWVVLNVIAWRSHWDPYPFILLNLVLSFQAAYTAPIILMSQNRMNEQDRKRAQIDFSTNKKAEKEIRAILESLEALEKDKIDKILGMLKTEDKK